MKEPFLSLYRNDIPCLTDYTEHGKINIVDEHHRSLLHHAIKLGLKDAFSLLIGCYIDLDIEDDMGNTCYHYAVLHNRLSFLRILFLKGGNPMQKNKEGRTPLYLACRYGKESIIDLYLEKYQLDMGEKDNLSQTICMALVLSGGSHLLDKYGNYLSWLEEPNYLGETPLMLAVKLENIKMTEFILSKGVFVNQKNNLGESAIFYAVRKDNRELFKVLFHAGAFLDFKNHYGENSYERAYPLQYAIYVNNQREIEKNLVLPYAILEDDFHYTPLQLAEKYHLMDVIKAIKHLEKQAKIQTFRTKV